MMYTKIKQLADDAIALQNKDRMDAALREISEVCYCAHESALNDLISDGTGIVVAAVNDAGEISVNHVPVNSSKKGGAK
jgi:hypothetical protein